uniref:Uncharacterized protein n=1 Tax=Rhizophora mucronata TaxID=61149 RepID=A0A2P2N2U5_RHIMU
MREQFREKKKERFLN